MLRTFPDGPRTPARAMTRFALLDDHAVLRTGLKALIESEPGWSVAGDFGTYSALRDWPLLSGCDVLVLDLSLPDVDGMLALRHLRRAAPALQVVIYSMHDNPLFMQEALASGAKAYVCKQDDPSALMASLQSLLGGDSAKPVETHTPAPPQTAGSTPARIRELTVRERELLTYLVRGAPIADIANALTLSPKTVYVHRANLMRKLGARTPMELLVMAQRLAKR